MFGFPLKSIGKESYTVGTVPKSNSKIVDKGNITTTNTQTNDRSCSCLDPGTSINCGEVKLLL
jgi:hypothetical protein